MAGFKAYASYDGTNYELVLSAPSDITEGGLLSVDILDYPIIEPIVTRIENTVFSYETSDTYMTGGNVLKASISSDDFALIDTVADLDIQLSGIRLLVLGTNNVRLYPEAEVPLIANDIQIGTTSEVETYRLDIFKDLPLVHQRKIQDFRDITKVYTNNIFNFDIPWSKRNRRLFGDYHRLDVDGGFDARTFVTARIELNGRPYDKGLLELTGVKFENGTPSAGEVAFYGELALITEQFGDDTLADLVESWSMELNAPAMRISLVGDGNFNSFLQSNTPVGWEEDSIKYMLNSSGRRLIFDSSNNGSAENQAYDEADPPTRNLSRGSGVSGNDEFSGLDVEICKPWIKADTLLTLIENRYEGVDFDRTSERSFFRDPRWTNLYMMLHNKTDKEDVQTGNQAIPFSISNADKWLIYSGNLRVMALGSTFNIHNATDETVEFALTISPANGDSYSLSVETSSSFDIESGQTNLQNISGERTMTFEANNGSFYFQIEAPEDFTYDASIVANVRPGLHPISTGVTTASGGSTNNIITAGRNFFIGQNMPNIKVIDWLSGIWKLKNLTAFYNTDITSNEYNEIVVETLDAFYSDEDVDITKYVNPYEFDINRSEFYSDIQFEFANPVTLLGTNFEDTHGRQYGEEKWDGTDSDSVIRKINNQYKVQVPFSQFPYDIIPGITGVVYPYVASDSGDTTSIAPHFAYPVQTAAPTGVDIAIVDSTLGITGDSGGTYMRASKVYDVGGEFETSLLFYPEFDEYLSAIGAQNQIVNNTLFRRYYSNYTAGVFSAEARVREGGAYLPPSILEDLTADKSVIIGNDRFRQNSLKTDLLTGKSMLELVKYFPIDDRSRGRNNPVPGDDPIVTLIGNSVITGPSNYIVDVENLDEDETVTEYRFIVGDAAPVQNVNVENATFLFTPEFQGVYVLQGEALINGEWYSSPVLIVAVIDGMTTTTTTDMTTDMTTGNTTDMTTSTPPLETPCASDLAIQSIGTLESGILQVEWDVDWKDATSNLVTGFVWDDLNENPVVRTNDLRTVFHMGPDVDITSYTERPLQSLLGEGTWHVRAFAGYNNSYCYSDTVDFTLQSAEAAGTPDVVTVTNWNNEGTFENPMIRIRGVVRDDGRGEDSADLISNAGFYYSLLEYGHNTYDELASHLFHDTSPSYRVNIQSGVVLGDVEDNGWRRFDVLLEDNPPFTPLEGNQEYYFAAWASNGINTGGGNARTFQTAPDTDGNLSLSESTLTFGYDGIHNSGGNTFDVSLTVNGSASTDFVIEPQDFNDGTGQSPTVTHVSGNTYRVSVPNKSNSAPPRNAQIAVNPNPIGISTKTITVFQDNNQYSGSTTTTTTTTTTTSMPSTGTDGTAAYGPEQMGESGGTESMKEINTSEWLPDTDDVAFGTPFTQTQTYNIETTITPVLEHTFRTCELVTSPTGTGSAGRCSNPDRAIGEDAISSSVVIEEGSVDVGTLQQRTRPATGTQTASHTTTTTTTTFMATTTTTTAMPTTTCSFRTHNALSSSANGIYTNCSGTTSFQVGTGQACVQDGTTPVSTNGSWGAAGSQCT